MCIDGTLLKFPPCLSSVSDVLRPAVSGHVLSDPPNGGLGSAGEFLGGCRRAVASLPFTSRLTFVPCDPQVALKIFGMVGGPILGVFCLGLFFPWANSTVSFLLQGEKRPLFWVSFLFFCLVWGPVKTQQQNVDAVNMSDSAYRWF